MGQARAGIVGTGFAASSHVDALRRIGVDIAGIAGSSRAKAARAADAFGIPRAFADLGALLDDDSVDVVHNCTPNHLHAEVNAAALAAGRHLLSEKPLGMSSAETLRLVDLAAATPAVTGVCFNYRHYPLVRQAKTFMEEGTYGRPHLVHGSYLQDWLLFEDDWNWRLDSGKAGPSRAVADIGSHWLDLVQYVTGDTVTEVCAHLGTLHPTRTRPEGASTTFARSEPVRGEVTAIDTEDYATVLLRFGGGAGGSFLVSQVSAGRKNRLFFEIDAARASFAWDQEEPNTLWIGHRDQSNQELARDPALLAPEAARLAHFPGGHQEGWPDGLKNLLLDFYAAVADGDVHGRSFATFREAHRIVVVVEAIVASDRERAWVEVDGTVSA